MGLDMQIEKVKGVGPKTAELFRTASITNVGELAAFLPRAFEDFSALIPISEVRPGNISVHARVENVATRQVRRGMYVTTATLSDESGKMQAVWFNQPYRAAQLGQSETFYFTGKFEFSYNKYQLQNPSVEKTSNITDSTDKIVPIYREVRGLKSAIVKKAIEEIKPLINLVPESLPSDVLKRERLMNRAETLYAMHFPNTLEDVETARYRLAFEELFDLMLAAQLNKDENSKLEGWSIPFDAPVAKEFVTRLPFSLTNGQRTAAWEIFQDMEGGSPMNRLLQGDVGSGKTAVAAFGAYMAAKAGYQTALMAPTELLAAQHATGLRELLAPLGIEVALLTGSVKGKPRKAIYEAIASGDAQIIIGTHALITEKLEYKKLGFAVIDEQHRFGVNQRQALLAKSKRMPHLLAMTATPIPRSLALTIYGEMDVSILSELPAGRKRIETKIWSPNSREQLYKLVDAEIAAGRQAYVVCSLIEGAEDDELRSVQKEYDRLRNSIFKHRRIGLLHGKMAPADKDEVMGRFLRRELDILVSTTVIEVGIDVPNSTVMIIEDADRFGLSQLHQLRGRVGRGKHQSYCYLVSSTSKKPSRRLKELESSNDGFYLAEVDLELRGPGELYGKAQSGLLNLTFASLGDTKLIAKVQSAVSRFVKEGDLLRYKELKEQVERYQRLTTLN